MDMSSLPFAENVTSHPPYKLPAGKNEMGASGAPPAETNAILFLGGSSDRLVLLIVLSMASAALRLDSFLDLPLPVHNKFPTVIFVSKVLW